MAKANSSIAPNTPVTLSRVAIALCSHNGTGKGVVIKRVRGGYHVNIQEPNTMDSCPVCHGQNISQNKTTKEFRCIDCIGNPDNDHRGGFTTKTVYVKEQYLQN